MIITPFRGIARAKKGLIEYFAADLPVRVPAKVAQWQVVNDEQDPLNRQQPVERLLPQVTGDRKTLALLHHAPESIDRWPLVAVTSVSSSFARLDPVEGGVAYATTHALRVFGWVRDFGIDRAEETRDDLAAVLLESLLDGAQGFDCDGAHGGVLEDTLRATYSDATPLTGDRYLAAVQIDVSVMIDEAVTRPSLGTVATTRVTGHASDDLIHPSEL